METEDCPGPNLRRGWTTGACATAAAKAAMTALATGDFPDPVTIALPGGERPAFALAQQALDEHGAMAAIVKDAGDDPDVTHGALIRATLRRLPRGAGLVFRAGEGVGTVTRPGLPLPPGEPAINPVPRRMIAAALAEVEQTPDVEVTISIAGGERLAQRTLNGRLGIVGGLSVLGTTGIVVPYSCAAWIDSIHRGIDVARAMGLPHIAGSTGSASEAAVRRLHDLPEVALIEMGDFVGGMLKYLRRHPVPRITIAGGVAKMTKLAQGRLDLHSKRGTADMAALAELAGMPELAACNTVAEAFSRAGDGLGDLIAARARDTAAEVLRGTDIALEVAVFDREGRLVGHSPPLNRRR
ncbi:cobalt-precorrin-5B (C(1))-methyltransferase [Roseococcus pinisoli]|uniref:Cobalt-precorrin-5B C(1)-methyltransferase n=1 Tax=Roseococcus pinisoli TaxID=2835040 RepID=A0ABS5QLK5_9PROT|nr:cobalt-precorrin-5B (C(1))-methyltransferase [Roseococcus pinisoli]MBS7813708.1 cobalt-precorrin-5B (C(1))-methyltransferase [Roseococcus pinisoli]